MSEWFKEAVLKIVGGAEPSVGSSPTSPAKVEFVGIVATLTDGCFVCSVLDSATEIEVESGAKLIDIKELFKCETCFHNKYNGCNTFCDYGESYRPAVSKFKTIETH